MKNKGFTLIELMVIVAIIGILSTVSYSSYIHYVIKGVRSSSLPHFSALFTLQEDHYRDARTYTTDLVGDLKYPSDPAVIASSRGGDAYKVKASACDNAAIYPDTPSLARCVKIIATPQGAQAEDGLILMDSRGRYVLDFGKTQLKSRDGTDLPDSACPECIAVRGTY